MLNKNTKDLILIGNGFDLWQKLPTSFSCFEKYYYTHKDEIEKKLNLKPVELNFINQKHYLNLFEMFYSFYPTQGDCISENNNIKPTVFWNGNFWSNFENNLYSCLDLEGIVWGYGIDEEDIREIPNDMFKMNMLLTELFTSWIRSINIEERPSEYNFENAFFINFNYSETLKKRFNVTREQDFHIHGTASNKNSIIFGHGKRPKFVEVPLPTAEHIGTLYCFLELLWMLYKKPQKRVEKLNKYITKNNLTFEQFEDIYALGLSFGKSDFYYYKYISTKCPNAKWHISYHSNKDKQQVLRVLKKLNITNFELLNTIEETIKRFKTA